MLRAKQTYNTKPTQQILVCAAAQSYYIYDNTSKFIFNSSNDDFNEHFSISHADKYQVAFVHSNKNGMQHWQLTSI